jgi:uncharacterized membrane protein YgaE (UPF0421/DUF939 family)
VERFLRPIRPVLLHRLTLLALRSGVAAAVAFFVGAHLPGPFAEYAYYASLGAISVIYPALSDSFWESLRATGAILLGAVLAAAVQWIAWPNALTVGLIVTVAVALSGMPWFGEQRHWVAAAALFVLVFSTDPPHDYILVYVGQIAVGAAVGLAVNAAFPSLNLTSLSQAVEALRRELVRQLHSLADRLRRREDPDEEDLEAVFEGLERERAALRTALQQVERSRKGNPRARRHKMDLQALSQRAHALARVGFLLQDVGVVLQDAQRQHTWVVDDALREATAGAFHDLATLLEEPGADAVARAGRSVSDLAQQVMETEFESIEVRYLASVLVASAQLSLSSASERVAGERSA